MLVMLLFASLYFDSDTLLTLSAVVITCPTTGGGSLVYFGDELLAWFVENHPSAVLTYRYYSP